MTESVATDRHMDFISTCIELSFLRYYSLNNNKQVSQQIANNRLTRDSGQRAALTREPKRWGRQSNVEYAIKIIDGWGGTEKAMPLD